MQQNKQSTEEKSGPVVSIIGATLIGNRGAEAMLNFAQGLWT